MSNIPVASSSPPLKYLLVLDFEATCGDAVSHNEIIEFPTLVYNIKDDKVDATFHEYVRPVDHPTLTPFCTELTGITQEVVDKADTFPHVWKRFQDFMKSSGLLDDPDSQVFLTCGKWDLATMLPKQLLLIQDEHGLDAAGKLVAPYRKYINIKEEFRKHYKLSHQLGMAGMLKRLKLDLEGRHHSGIDDCRNILRIVQIMLKDGWKPQIWKPPIIQ
ncbi:exonuclease [Abortiporus biennis]|nr:exonuclease [Abortiporus biennis]